MIKLIFLFFLIKVNMSIILLIFATLILKLISVDIFLFILESLIRLFLQNFILQMGSPAYTRFHRII